jgi:5-formaminoimidazole-4-carboxamide-1-beta-D-ribofuranosyl 5'-monophosphate synthetase
MKIFKNIFLLLALILLGCNNQSIQSENSVFQPNRSLSELIGIDEINLSIIDSAYVKRFNVWNPFISVNTKLSRLTPQSNDHRSIFNSIKLDLQDINQNNIPYPFNKPEVIGRLRVVKTFVYKVNSYELNAVNLKSYKEDVNMIMESYSAFVEKLNALAEEAGP